jgi:quinol monooxygenase YgiN
MLDGLGAKGNNACMSCLAPDSVLRGLMTVRNSSRPIARVFRATAAPGCREELLQRFHSSSATLVNSKAGCLKYRILEPVDTSAPEVVFESIWRDLDAVKVAFGDAWQQSHLPEGYSALMSACSVHHFLVSESSTTNPPLSFDMTRTSHNVRFES